MSSYHLRDCEGGCDKRKRTRRGWTCSECADRIAAQEYQEYLNSPLGELDDVEDLEQLKDWIRRYWRQA